MSLNHINTNELDANFKSLKVNNQPINTSTTTKEFINFSGNFGVQNERYLQPWSGDGTSGTNLANQISPYKAIKIVGMICRKNNPQPDTNFILYKSNITLDSFLDLITINLPAGSQFGTSLVLNIPITSSELLWCRTNSTGGSPQEVQVIITYEQV